MGPVYESVRRTGRCVITHEAHVNLGMGAEMAARVTEQCFYSLEAPVLRVGAFDMPYPPSRIEEEYLPDLDRVLDAVDRSLRLLRGTRPCLGVPAPRRRRGPHRGRDRRLEGQGRRHDRDQRRRRRDRDRQVARRAARRRTRAPSSALLVAEGEMVEVGTPIISIGAAGEVAAAPSGERRPGGRRRAGPASTRLDIDLSKPRPLRLDGGGGPRRTDQGRRGTTSTGRGSAVAGHGAGAQTQTAGAGRVLARAPGRGREADRRVAGAGRRPRRPARRIRRGLGPRRPRRPSPARTRAGQAAGPQVRQGPRRRPRRAGRVRRGAASITRADVDATPELASTASAPAAPDGGAGAGQTAYAAPVFSRWGSARPASPIKGVRKMTAPAMAGRPSPARTSPSGSPST